MLSTATWDHQMSSCWTNKIASGKVTKQLDGFAAEHQGDKLDWGGETSYGFVTRDQREKFIVSAKAAGFDLHSGVSGA
jgi:hypothetical protein